MAGNIKKAYRINVKKPVYAILISDTKTSVAYEAVEKFSEAMQIQVTPEVASGQLYGDGVKQSEISKLVGITLVIDATKVPINVRAKINGNKYENGVLTEHIDDKPPWIAFGYEVEQDEKNTSEYIWLLKGRAQPYASTVQQATENVNYSTDSVTINFVPREFDGEFRKTADSADSTFTEEMADKWFDNVPGEIEG